VCSEPDRQLLGGGDRIHVIPNGYTSPTSPPERVPVSPARIGFVGNFGHAPNRDGIQWFIREVWPQLLRAHPTLRLRLAGGGAGGLECLPAGQVDTLDWVEDLEAEMATWSLAVVPIRFGGGTRVKLAEAFSRKCPVVSTPIGAFGYEVENRRELLLAETPAEFATACSNLLNDPAAASWMAERAWMRFLDNWTWEAQFTKVATAAASVLESSNGDIIR
jgi:polysaccharide biosynthesis protein PslH